MTYLTHLIGSSHDIHIRFVCRAGTRRSVSLSEYVAAANPRIVTSSSPFEYTRLIRSLSKRDSRLRRMFSDYPAEVRDLREGNGHVHPRFGVLMLQEGISGISAHRSAPVNDGISDVDLVLTVDYSMARGLRERYPGKLVYPIMSFIGRSGDLPDIKVYSLPFLPMQMRQDRDSLKKLRDIGQMVVEKAA